MSLAYARAIASTAGCALEVRDIDMYSVDVTFHHADPKTGWSPRQLEAQLKCTTQGSALQPTHLKWSLKKQAYNRLASTKVLAHAVLIVLVVPSSMDEWLVQAPDQLLMAGEAYWVSLRGKPEIDTASKVVHLPRKQVFGVQPLLDIFDRLGNGGAP